MNASTESPTGPGAGEVPDRRQTPDRRIQHSILNQEALARIVVEERGAGLSGGAAVHLTRHPKADLSPTFSPGGDTLAFVGNRGTGEDELIVYSLRGQWLVAPVKEIRKAMLDAAAAACRRRSTRSESGSELRQREGPQDSTMRGAGR